MSSGIVDEHRPETGSFSCRETWIVSRMFI